MRKMKDQQMEELIRVTQQFHGLRRYLNFCEGLPPSEFFMLATIKRFLCRKKREGQKVLGIAVSELALELEITNPAASKMLRSVEDKAISCVCPIRPTGVSPTLRCRRQGKQSWSRQKHTWMRCPPG